MEPFRILPPVLRARGFRLYLDGGKRLVDLWQTGGKAILGHKTPRVVFELKNAAERGLFSPFPHHYETRLYKALSTVFSDCENEYSFRLYNSVEAMEKALSMAGFRLTEPFPDPAISLLTGSEPCLWRPFTGKKIQPPLMIPILPFPLSPFVLVMEKSLEGQFPASDLISPMILSATARAVYDLISAADNGNRPVYSRINKVLTHNTKWKRRGIYLSLSPNAGVDWAVLWKLFFDGGFLLPPSCNEPLILPGEMSKGEENKLAELLNL